MTDWFSELQKAKKSCIVDKNLKRVHFDFGDGREMVEEYDLTTNVVTRRAWRVNKELKGENVWEIEIGEPEPIYSAEEKCMIRENATQPFVTKRITKNNLEWRIRNLSYPIDVYSVIADRESNCLIVKTSNKKYYKKLVVIDLERLGISVEQENVAFSHKFSTLIITFFFQYKKPKKLIEFEKAMLEEIKKVQPKSYDEVNNCKTS